jgi:hypothetical protein
MSTSPPDEEVKPERFVVLTGKHIHDREANAVIEITSRAKTYAEQQTYLRDLTALLNRSSP